MSQSTPPVNLEDFQPQSNRPLAEQVAAFIRQKINHGDLPEGSILPASSRFDGISHVTILKAYQQLEREGLIEIRRSRGSRVIAPLPTQQYVLITQNADNHATLYENQIVASTYNVARFSDQPPRVHYLPTCKINTQEQAATILAPSLAPLLQANLVRGVIVNHPGNLIGVIYWLNAWKLPVVGLNGPVGNSVYTDITAAGNAVVAHLKQSGYKRILLHMPPDYNHHRKAIGKNHRGIVLETYSTQFSANSAICYGKHLAKQLLNIDQSQRPDALILFDDMVALGLRMALAQRNMKKSEVFQLALITHRSQILDAFDDVDLMLFETDHLIEQAIGIIESIIKNRQQPQTRTVGFSFIQPASKSSLYGDYS